MLRNEGGLPQRFRFRFFLNEVLSLNAQEYAHTRPRNPSTKILNEVLSLNAQEWDLALVQKLQSCRPQ